MERHGEMGPAGGFENFGNLHHGRIYRFFAPNLGCKSF
jgi:hypothetical protein